MKIEDCASDGSLKSSTVFFCLLSFFYLVLRHSVPWCSNLRHSKTRRGQSYRKEKPNETRGCFDMCPLLDLTITPPPPTSFCLLLSLASLQTHEFLCIQSEPNLCDPGPVGGAAFPQRQHQPAGHGHGWHRQTGSHDIPRLWWWMLTQKTGRDWRRGSTQRRKRRLQQESKSRAVPTSLLFTAEGFT